jgi:enediyne biosynthesis protein E5
VTELVLSRILYGRWPNLASAYISGISVGILVRSLADWPYFIAAALAIMSKYVLRFRGRHLWNPSNFSIVLLLLTAPTAVNILSRQWSNSLLAIAVIWSFGLLVVWRVSRLHVTLTYLGAFAVGAAFRSWLTQAPLLAEIAPVTGPMYQLFIFFMVTDPPTGVSSRRGRVIVVVLVAAVETVLRLFEQVNAPLYALFLVGPAALALELARQPRRADP